jgi:hypothetical protein
MPISIPVQAMGNAPQFITPYDARKGDYVDSRTDSEKTIM